MGVLKDAIHGTNWGGKADELEFSSIARLDRPTHVEIDYEWAGAQYDGWHSRPGAGVRLFRFKVLSVVDRMKTDAEGVGDPLTSRYAAPSMGFPSSNTTCRADYFMKAQISFCCAVLGVLP
jgi:hypothetical protein